LYNFIFLGYGAGGRLGIGGTDSVMVPTLLESIQHVFIKKVIIITSPQYFHCTVRLHFMLNDLRISLIYYSNYMALAPVISLLLNAVTDWLALLLYIWAVPGSDVNVETVCPD
jgi:hypothetical protein